MGFVQKELEVFVGRGITLPLKLENGRVPVETGTELIKSSIRMILGWVYGTRFFLNEFGSRIEQLQNDPSDKVTRNILEDLTDEAIRTWEKRVEVVEIKATSNQREGRVDLSIAYRIRATDREDTVIYPFYYQIAS